MISREEALTRDTFYLIERRRTGGKANRVVTVRRSGKTKTWKTRPDEWDMPVKYGLYTSFHLTQFDAADIYSDPEVAQMALRYPDVPFEEACARDIASQWQTGMGTALDIFARTGKVDGVEFKAIVLELAACEPKDEADAADLKQLTDYVVHLVVAEIEL